MLNHILTPPHILVGAGAVRHAAAVLRRAGCVRPLLVVDPAIGAARPGALPACGAGRGGGSPMPCSTGWWRIQPMPCVADAAAAVLRGQHDGVLGFGGGSAIDTAKAAALVASTGEPIGAFRLPRIADEAIMPVVAVAHDSRHRQRSHAGLRHHRCRHAREDADPRRRLPASRGDRGLRADPVVPVPRDRRYRPRCAHPRAGGAGQPQPQSACRRAGRRRPARDRRQPGDGVPRARQPRGAGGDDAGRDPSRNGRLQHLHRSGAWHEPAAGARSSRCRTACPTPCCCRR